ncbi:conserved hypothetical protein [Ricinus communis]|uniref:Uncharacterized protein n=1 Tax=Ricinus communis TaxID=3988 RepID=B9THE9_RICCO|nr:conserved hypothetical protein [Ricinus communis]
MVGPGYAQAFPKVFDSRKYDRAKNSQELSLSSLHANGKARSPGGLPSARPIEKSRHPPLRMPAIHYKRQRQ